MRVSLKEIARRRLGYRLIPVPAHERLYN